MKAANVLKILLRFVGVPFLTSLLFMFQCSDPMYYIFWLLGCFALSIVLWEGNRHINSFFDNRLSWDEFPIWRVLLHLMAIVLFSGIVNYCFITCCYRGIVSSEISRVEFGYYYFIVFVISVLYSAIFSGEHFYKNWKNSLLVAEELKRQNILAQYESLKDQVNPHFLFNSINTIAGLIEEDKDLAIAYCEHFGKIYRYILEHRNDELVSLQSELNIFENHAFLLKGRFRDNIKIIVNIDDNDKTKYIPPLTLQMLLENAVKHNVISKEQPLTIQVDSNDGKALIFKNNLQRKNTPKNSTRVGLDNLKKRYLVFAQKEVEVMTENGDFIVKIPLLEKKQHEPINH